MYYCLVNDINIEGNWLQEHLDYRRAHLGVSISYAIETQYGLRRLRALLAFPIRLCRKGVVAFLGDKLWRSIIAV